MTTCNRIVVVAFLLLSGVAFAQDLRDRDRVRYLGSADCNDNGISDLLDIDFGTSEDCNRNQIPDECEVSGTASLEELLGGLEKNAGSIGQLVPDLFPFSEGESGSFISDGGNDMYDGGNSLNTELSFGIPYTGSSIVSSDAQFGPGSRYFTAKFKGLFFLAAEDIAIDSFTLSGNNGADGSGSADGVILSTIVNTQRFTIFVKRVFNAFDPSINQMIVVAGTGEEIDHAFSTFTDDTFQQVSGLAGAGIDRIYYILTAREFGAKLEDEQVLAVVRAFLENVAGPGGAEDCNENGAPDECDLADGTSLDCNENGLPDECEPDCNGNGVPDECDLALGAADCNGNGVLDECEMVATFRAYSGHLSPFHSGSQQSFTVVAPPPALGDVRLSFFALSGFSSFFGDVNVLLEGQPVGTIFGTDGSFCVQATDELVLEADLFNSFAPGPVTIQMVPSFNVSQFCGLGQDTFVRVVLEIPAEGADCNQNGVLDSCDVAEGTSPDLDFDGVPDGCETEEVALRLIVRDAQTGIDSLTGLPVPQTLRASDDPFVVEVWATSRGLLDSGFTGLYTHLLYDPALVQALNVVNRPPFTVLADGALVVDGFVDDIGGNDLTFSCRGADPSWARVAVIEFEGQGECGRAEFNLQPSPLEVSLCGEGAIDPEEISFGTAYTDLGTPCIYDLDDSGCVEFNDAAIFLSCFGTVSGDPDFDPSCDFDCNGLIGAGDLGFLSAVLGRCCGTLTQADFPECQQCSPAEPLQVEPVAVVLRPVEDLTLREGPPLRHPGPPREIDSIRVGRTFLVEVWIPDPDVVAFHADLIFDPKKVEILGLEYGESFDQARSGKIARDKVEGFGAIDFDRLTGSSQGERLLGRVRVRAIEAGPAKFTGLTGPLGTARVGSGNATLECVPVSVLVE